MTRSTDPDNKLPIDPIYNPPPESRKIILSRGRQKRYLELEAKRDTINNYMKKIRSDMREHREPSNCICCGVKHFTDEDLCPECTTGIELSKKTAQVQH